MYQLRPNQQKILEYQRGRMGISAVPGSGKTYTLSLLAARLIGSAVLAPDQEVLVVTLVNSAVDNFNQRVGQFIHGWGLLPNLGYRVRTLHGLAHDIVRERPGLVGLADRFGILDEREAQNIRGDVARAWLAAHPDGLDEFLDPELADDRRRWLLREKAPELVQELALAFIRYAKDQELNPPDLQRALAETAVPLPLVEMGVSLYADYQRSLTYRGAVDFDDLIRLGLQALKSDEAFLARLRHRWPFILEDEAQDSSRLQEEILRLLSGPTGNWVRVGDPNQAIYETFTTANPKYLRAFIEEPGVSSMSLPHSGRSTASIIRLANQLVRWTMDEHPLDAARSGLYAPPYIEPTPPGDPQPNPADSPRNIHLLRNKYSPRDEVIAVVESLARWLPDHQGETVAVLVPRNQRGFELVDELRARRLPFHDGLLRSSTSTRLSAGALGAVLRYLSVPHSPAGLARAFHVWRRSQMRSDDTRPFYERVHALIKKLPQVEDYLWPGPQHDWLEELQAEAALAADPDLPVILDELRAFKGLVHRWHGLILLPVDQVLLALAQDLLSEPSELAVAHKLSVLLRQASRANPAWRLPELTEELVLIAKNERRFLGFSDDETGFVPENYKGQVVVGTIHRAKGLEWDRVYLMSVSSYDFPSGEGYESYIAEKWFLNGKLNLPAEMLAQLQAAVSSDEYTWPEQGQATLDARQDYIRERLRLLYVGMTRARRDLIVTFNTGRRGDQQPAVPLLALLTWWEAHRDDPIG